ncbi:hypothetical protein SELMODRAFT_132602 [Selaginella moellendorffii]|uniref:RNA methyltransferase n=1 Tax=Selaginella moellendorffii TaxID=88036 RepID=D8T5W1_SELML|nr:hypothetical protein SELMODRAFT_132602 [Selaginella moellendorffii]
MQGSQQQQRQDSGKKRKKPEYVYGNYPFYYGYRVGKTLEEDPRVSVFKQEWIENRDCLDIGCNEGHVTIALAVKFCCKSMVGVDIDSKLIYKARCNLQHENSGKTPSTDSEEAAVEQKAAKCGVVAGGKHTAKEAGDDVLSGLELSERVTFKTQNYLDVYCKPGTYDTILCLSISKWIHLNWGDEGLLKFFAKVFKELRPGGRLVLEPQPWESYSKKRRVSEVTRKNFQRIKLRPDNFPSILTEKIGFKFYEEISSELPSDKSGFRRPLFVYHK